MSEYYQLKQELQAGEIFGVLPTYEVPYARMYTSYFCTTTVVLSEQRASRKNTVNTTASRLHLGDLGLQIPPNLFELVQLAADHGESLVSKQFF